MTLPYDNAENDPSELPIKSNGVAEPLNDRTETKTQNPDVGETRAAETRKRGADRQITKDDGDEDIEDHDIASSIDTMSKASEDVLKHRKIVKVARREDGSVNWSKKKSNPFTSVNLKADASSTTSGSNVGTSTTKNEDHPVGSQSKSSNSTSIFGVNAPFSGFGAVRKGGGFGNSSDGTNLSGGFGSGAGFGAFVSASSSGTTSTKDDNTNPFRSFGSPLKGFGASGGNEGSSSATAGEDAATSEGSKKTFNFPSVAPGQRKVSTGETEIGQDTTNAQNTGDETGQSTGNKPDTALLPTDYQPQSGEENEIVLIECRCKTHRWGPAMTADSKDEATSASLASAAVPPTESSLTKKNEPSSLETASTTANNHENDQSGCSGKSIREGDDESKSHQLSSTSCDMTWHEVGVGPLRVLQPVKETPTGQNQGDKTQPSSVRLVQRRQVHTSQATKVLLNQRLFSESTVSQPSDRHVKFTTPGGDGGAATFLFRCGKVQEALDLTTVLQQELSKAPSCFADSNTNIPKEKNADNDDEGKSDEKEASGE